MRVVAGSAKGRRLIGPATTDTRPLTDRAKEALFSSIGDRVAGAVVLDLYAGSGGIGIEALSRGADRAVFVEKGREALEALRHNLATVGFERVVVIARAVEAYLATARGDYDLVFCDPPWLTPTEEIEELMAAIDGITTAGAEFIVHRRAPDREPVPPLGWRHVTTRRYGDGKMYRYIKEPI